MAVARGRDNAGGAWSNAVVGICMFLAVTAVMVQRAQAGVVHLVGGTQHWAAPGLFNAFNNSYLNDWASTQTFVTGDTLCKFAIGFLFFDHFWSSERERERERKFCKEGDRCETAHRRSERCNRNQ
jgi:hypothetical protein